MRLNDPDCLHTVIKPILFADGIAGYRYTPPLVWEYRHILPVFDRCLQCGRLKDPHSTQWVKAEDYLVARLSMASVGEFLPVFLDGLSDEESAYLVTAIVKRTRRRLSIVVNLPIVWLVVVG